MKKSSNIGILLIILAIVGFVVVIIPQGKTFGSRELAVKSTTTELNSYNQRISDLSTLKSQGSSFQGIINSLYQAMPSSSQIPETLVTIEDLGNNNGVTFTGVDVDSSSNSTTAAVSGAASVPVTVSFTGNLSNVQAFLDALYNNIRTINVVSQTVSSDNSGNLTVTMELGLVYQGGSN